MAIDLSQIQGPQDSGQLPQLVGNPDLNRYVQQYNELMQLRGGNTGWGASQDPSGINRELRVSEAPLLQ